MSIIGVLIGVAIGLIIGGGTAIAFIGIVKKPVLSYDEFSEIHWNAYNEAIETAAAMLEKFAKDGLEKPDLLRHAALIRNLKRPLRTEAT